MNERHPSRHGWTLAIVAVLLAAASVPYYIASWTTPGPAQTFGIRGFAVVLAVEFAITGLILVRARPANPIGWLALVGAIGAGLQALTDAYALWAVAEHGSTSVPARVVATAADWIWYLGLGALALAMALFPDGKPLSKRWGTWIKICVAGTLVTVFTGAITDRPLIYAGTHNPLGVPGMRYLTNGFSVFFFLLLLTSMASLVVRLRRSTGDEREQMRWITFSVGLTVVAFTAYFVAYAASHGNADTRAANLLESAILLGVVTIPASIGIGILKYRLYDIDVVISKTFVYGVLAALIALVYVVIVAGVGALVGSGTSPVLSAVAAAVIAVAFQPARRRVQRVANRLVYGERASPYEVLSEFAERLSGSYSMDDVLPRLTHLVADGTGASEVRVWLRLGPDLRPAAAWPDDAPPAATVGDDRDLPGTVFEVRHQGEDLGAITLVMAAGDTLSGDQERLVSDVAAQAGLVLRNVGLIEELKASRQRLVVAQDEERRKLERNIHDGAQQQLVALAVKQRLASSLLGKDDARAHAMLEELADETNDALENLRDLARGIYPPLLADKGLVAALEAQARKAAVPTTVEGGGIGRFGQDVEAAVYFSCLESLQNVAKYAEASRATIALSNSDGSLTFAVTDDGVGFDASGTSRGTGLQGIADRLAALGGDLSVRSAPGAGTTVSGRLPATAEAGG